MVGRVVLNAPREMPPHHRPSWNSWIRPSLTNARPSSARQKSVISPCAVRRKSVANSAHHAPPISECRKMSATDECPPVRRPSDVRRKSVAEPWRVCRVSRSDRSHVRRWTRRRPQSAASPCEPPRTNATRTNTRRTPHRTRPNDERTTDEHTRARSTGVPRKHEDRRLTKCRPLLARSMSVGIRILSVTSPFHARIKTVCRP